MNLIRGYSAENEVITRETAYVPYTDASQITMYKERPEIKSGFRSDQKVRVFSDYLSVEERKEEVSA